MIIIPPGTLPSTPARVGTASSARSPAMETQMSTLALLGDGSSPRSLTPTLPCAVEAMPCHLDLLQLLRATSPGRSPISTIKCLKLDFTSRQAAGGSFRVTNEVDLNADNLPPGQVTDLKLTNLGDVVRVQFTAPGDDLDSSDAAAEYIVKFSSTAANLTGANFDRDEWNTRVVADMLHNSDLDPIVGGSIKSFDICLACAPFSKNEKYVLAMKAVDEAGNPSRVSNKAQLFIPHTSATTTTVSTITTETPPACPK